MTKIFVSWIIMLFFLCFLMTWFLSIVNTFGRLLFYYVFFFQYILAKLRVLPIGSDISYIWVTGGTGLELFPDCFSVHVLRNLILSSFSFSVFFFSSELGDRILDFWKFRIQETLDYLFLDWPVPNCYWLSLT